MNRRREEKEKDKQLIAALKMELLPGTES